MALHVSCMMDRLIQLVTMPCQQVTKLKEFHLSIVYIINGTMPLDHNVIEVNVIF